MTITPITPADFVICCASHSDAILDQNLRRSACLATVPLHVERNAPSASVAYNRALAATSAPIVIFAHHDVYLPPGWDALLARRLNALSVIDPTWATFGSFGIGMDGRQVGPVWSSSIGYIVGAVPMAPVRVQAYDELLIVLRRDSGIGFDPALPGWHMYGPDIAQSARAAGRGAWAGALPCIHNDRYHEALGPDFTECYRFMQRKWAADLPIQTAITKISRSGLHLLRDNWRNRRSNDYRQDMGVGTGHPVEDLADRCGWSNLG